LVKIFPAVWADRGALDVPDATGNIAD
jgi:hypothetical protein